ncbi:MAG TPA: hypothetical protein VF572_05270 [Candidatus Saccharimonadales bacterium]|jgi:hypothetical protein
MARLTIFEAMPAVIDRYGKEDATQIYDEILSSRDFANHALQLDEPVTDIYVHVATAAETKQSFITVEGKLVGWEDVELTIGEGPAKETMKDIRGTVVHEILHLDHKGRQSHRTKAGEIQRPKWDVFDYMMLEGVAMFGEEQLVGACEVSSSDVADADLLEIVSEALAFPDTADPYEFIVAPIGKMNMKGYCAGHYVVSAMAGATMSLSEVLDTDLATYRDYARGLL